MRALTAAERYPDRKRGRMTKDDHAEIERMARAMKDPRPGVIAFHLGRHPSTVKWYMMRHGLLSQPAGYLGTAYQTRSGVWRHPWSPEQDQRLEKILANGGNYREAGEILSAEFGIRRTGHSCQVRAVMLAAAPDDVGSITEAAE
jgi:hypothetical protein